MILRPCDNCGGKGHVSVPGGRRYQVQHCPACVDMPWLPGFRIPKAYAQKRNLPLWVYDAETPSGSFKPDPSCVMRWCQKHKSAAEGSKRSRCQWSMLHLVDPDPSRCDVVWIERPTPLEEATDG